MGIRLITLTWNYENCIGYPNSRDLKDMGKGLKPFGFSVIDEMNRLGMIVDVSHLSEGPPDPGFGGEGRRCRVEFLSEFLGRERFMPNR